MLYSEVMFVIKNQNLNFTSNTLIKNKHYIRTKQYNKLNKQTTTIKNLIQKQKTKNQNKQLNFIFNGEIIVQSINTKTTKLVEATVFLICL